jgi:hypothetical protein
MEPYLTFLNVHKLERQGADILSKVEELEDVNSSLRERDKAKDDAIAHSLRLLVYDIMAFLILAKFSFSNLLHLSNQSFIR